MTAFNEYGALRRVALRHAREAFGSQAKIDAEWQALGYRARPDFGRAVAEYDRFVEIIEQSGAAIEFLPAEPGLGPDSLYVRDASLVTPGGMLSCRMGKPARDAEPSVASNAFRRLGIELCGGIAGEGRLEGGDFLWLDDKTAVVGQGYRSNAAGIAQLKERLQPYGVELVVVALPHYKGPDDVFHLMSMISPIDRDLALVHSPLLPVPFREMLLARGIDLVEVAAEEFDTTACNVLALAPRRCLMVDGNPQTRARLEAAGCEVFVYSGEEITQKGDGGPTCLTRPIERD